MILQNEYWFDIVPSRDTTKVTIAGKWLHFGPTQQLHSWLNRLDQLVEDGQLYAAKVARKLPRSDPFPDKPCVLCVFTGGNETSQKHAQEVVKNAFNIDVVVWKSEEQTRRDWSPGGWLQVEADVNHLRKRLEREGLAETDKSRLRELAERLRNSVEQIQEPSRVAEVELGRTRRLADQLSKELDFRDSSLPAILGRLEEIQNTLRVLTAQGQGSAPQAAEAVLAESTNSVFVIMPFAEQHVDTYDAIRRAIARSDQGLKVERVDERPGAIAITDEIRKSIRTARLIICDLTDERPNVYYELGFAHGLSKPIICIARKGTTIHFDVYGIKTTTFDTYRSLENDLANEVRLLMTADG